MNTTDLRAVLAAGDPAPVGSLAPGAHLLADRVTTATGAEPAGDLVVLRDAPRPPRRTRRTLAVAAVAALLVGGVVLTVRSTTGVSAEHREAAAILDRAADAIAASDPPTRPDQWWEITRTGFGSSSGTTADGRLWTVLVERPGTTYVAVDGSRPTVDVLGPPRVLRQVGGPAVPEAEVVASDQQPGVSTRPVAPAAGPATWQTPSPAFLAALPRDPAALAARLRSDTAGSGPSADAEMVTTIDDVLGSGLVPADLRAALLRVLGTVPGVVVSDDAVVVDGVTGVGFTRGEPVNGIREDIVVDPATGTVIGERQVATRDLDGVIPAGTVISQSTVTRRLVDAIPATLTVGDLTFRCTTAGDGRVTCVG